MGLYARGWPARFAAVLACVVVLQPIQVQASIVPAAAGSIRGVFVELGILSKHASGQVASRERLHLEAGKNRLTSNTAFAPVQAASAGPALRSNHWLADSASRVPRLLRAERQPGRSPPL